MKTRCQLHLCCHWPRRLLSIRGDFNVTYLPSQPQTVPNISSVTLPFGGVPVIDQVRAVGKFDDMIFIILTSQIRCCHWISHPA